MRGGEFSRTERFLIEDAIRTAEQVSRYEFSVFVGQAEGDPHAFATRLHQALVAPERSVMILVDLSARAVVVITGRAVRRHLTDAEVELAVLQMQTSFAEGGLVDGLRRGIQMLADHARAPETLHVRE